MLSFTGCAAETAAPRGIGPGAKGAEGKADSSAEATFVDMVFEGRLEFESAWNTEKIVEDQLLYTVGHLNGDRSVGRLDRVELSDVEVTTEGDRMVATYRATLPVAWGLRESVPDTYTFRLPRDMSPSGLERFAEAYGRDCVDSSAHDVTAGIMWYYYRPEAFRCELAEEDVVELTATVTPSDIETTGKFPEYDKVWEDGQLKVVAIFGKYEDGATSNYDAGIRAYNTFLSRMIRDLNDQGLVTEPAEVPDTPGVEMPEVTLRASTSDGRTLEIVTLLVDNVRTAGPEFNARYEGLTPDADLIFYNGHAGLGANNRALARKSEWRPGQYTIVFMNGCDTYAYVDSALWDARAAVNEDDPQGTKYLDVVTNALPSYFSSMPRATIALIEGLMNIEQPQTYEQIFRNIDSSQVVLVSGEHDNAFVPGGGGEPTVWEGLSVEGALSSGGEERYETPVLEAGSYRFSLRGTGDADLYVRIGQAPTAEYYDCRPYRPNSRETCDVEITTPAPVHVMVAGFSTESTFELEAGPL